jgi:hypothetical protein
MDDPLARFSGVHLSLLIRTPKPLGGTGGVSLAVANTGPEIEKKAL